MKKRLIFGLISLLISYILSFGLIGTNNFFYPAGTYLLFVIGFILIYDFITLKLHKKSLLNSLLKSKRNLINFVLISFVGGLILELIANWSGKLWIYPSIGWTTYFLTFVPGFAVYWLIICESYLATKSIIDYFKKGEKYITKSFKWENRLFNLLGILGLIFLIFTIFLIYLNYTNQSSPFIQKLDLSEKTSSYILPFYLMMGLFFGLWFILEYFQYNKKRVSLIKDILHSYSSPVFAVILGSFILAILMESQNLLYNFWIYVNWPFENITFIGLPISMFLAWPLHYILFLSLWRAFTDEQSEEVWKGDLIK